MSELPRGWVGVTIEGVGTITSGFGFPDRFQGNSTGDLPFAKVRDISQANQHNGGLLTTAANYVSYSDLPALKAKTVSTGSVAFAKIGEALKLNRRVLLGVEAVLDNNCMAVTPHDGVISPRFLYRFMTTVDFAPFAVATTVPSIRKGDVGGIPLPLPPLAEQKRIVAKLDALNAKSARARTELVRIETLVSRYKQAVLRKAFSGELTAPMPWDGALVANAVKRERERILFGQKTRNAKGTAPSPDRQPVEINALPKSWCVLPLEELCHPMRLIQYGILKPGPDTEGGVPYVKVMNIKGGLVDSANVRRTTLEIHRSYARSALKQGDLLLTIRGTVGRVAVTPVELDGGNITQDTVRIAVLNSVNSSYIYWYLQSPNAQRYFDLNKKGVAVQGINVGDVRPMEVPVAPPEEQHKIVRRIESAFAKIDQLAAEAKRALELMGKLDETILAKAFRGELVPQDENDEPAEKLLERIRAERAAAPKAKRGRGKAS